MNLCILGKLVLKEFNIEDEAGDAGIALAKTFIATVTHHSLRVYFLVLKSSIVMDVQV
jgi:hypothetical protein